jgi:FAD/FMN-containing dehydrogenase
VTWTDAIIPNLVFQTVGVGGGYVLGGGHSPLGSVHGLAADQVLAMEVVLANGVFTTVTAKSNPDLFWALRGGGGCESVKHLS